MNEQTLIAAAQLRAMLERNEPCVVLDCGFDLADPLAGGRAYAQGHLPRARYVNLDSDLSAAKTGRNGRHPLPERAAFARTVAAWGVQPGVPVVCYDDQGGPYAARAWWMLRWLGAAPVAVLDGGRAAWSDAGGVLVSDLPPPLAGAPFPMSERPGMPTVDANTVAARLGDLMLIDARSAERFRGDVEPLDPVAGHIPGARQRFFKDNLAADGRFRPRDALCAAFEVFGDGAASWVHQCGSGVTACHNLLAMEHAGLTGSSLYPGSWSEWCADPTRPVARG